MAAGRGTHGAVALCKTVASLGHTCSRDLGPLGDRWLRKVCEALQTLGVRRARTSASRSVDGAALDSLGALAYDVGVAARCRPPSRRTFCLGVSVGVAGIGCAGCSDGRFPGLMPSPPLPSSDMAFRPVGANPHPDLAGACGAIGNIAAGPASQIAVGSAKLVGAGPNFAGLFICRDALGLYAMAAVCTHQGCNISFVDATSGFACPCHGGTYGFDGNVTGGPPPLPLAHYAVCIDASGDVTIDPGAVVDASVRAGVMGD